jgi:hypothetical protein
MWRLRRHRPRRFPPLAACRAGSGRMFAICGRRPPDPPDVMASPSQTKPLPTVSCFSQLHGWVWLHACHLRWGGFPDPDVAAMPPRSGLLPAAGCFPSRRARSAICGETITGPPMWRLSRHGPGRFPSWAAFPDPRLGLAGVCHCGGAAPRNPGCDGFAATDQGTSHRWLLFRLGGWVCLGFAICGGTITGLARSGPGLVLRFTVGRPRPPDAGLRPVSRGRVVGYVLAGFQPVTLIVVYGRQRRNCSIYPGNNSRYFVPLDMV